MNYEIPTIKIAIFEMMACLIATFVPLFGIPFAFVALYSAFQSKKMFYKVSSIIVTCFVALLVVYWLISIWGTLGTDGPRV